MPAAPEFLVCKKCDNRQPDGEYCRSCGKPFADPPPPETGISRTNLVRVAVVALAIGGWYLFHSESPKPASTPDATRVYTAPDITSVGGLKTQQPDSKDLTPDELVSLATPYKITLLQRGKPIASGFLIEPTVIATTWHSIRNATTLTASFEDGSTATLHRVALHDDEHDIAILTLNPIEKSSKRIAAEAVAEARRALARQATNGIVATPSDTLSIGNAASLNQGDTVVSIGPPKGIDGSLYKGIVTGHTGTILQTNIEVTPLSSGEALLNLQGEVVGLLTDQIKDGAKDTHYALPINWVTSALHNASTESTATATANELTSLHTTLAPHQSKAVPFTTPVGLDPALLTLTYTSPQGTSDLRIQILRAQQTVYDSGASIDTTIKLKLQRGTYTLVLQNTSGTPHDAEIHGTFAAAP